MRGYASSWYSRPFILLVLVGYLGVDVSPNSISQLSTLLLFLIFILYKTITLNAICYYSHTLLWWYLLLASLTWLGI